MAALVNNATRKVAWKCDSAASLATWPPEKVGDGASSFKVTGVVAGRPTKMEVRREKQQGYLAGKKSSDIVRNYVCVRLRVSTVGALNASSSAAAASSLDDLRSSLGPFGSYLREEDHDYFIGASSSSTIRLWCTKTQMGELDAEYDIKSLVDGDEVTFVTNGPSLVVKRLHVVTKAARDLSNTDLKGETHLYGRGAVNVDAGGGTMGFAERVFSAKAAVASSGAQDAQEEDGDVDSDEWDD